MTRRHVQMGGHDAVDGRDATDVDQGDPEPAAPRYRRHDLDLDRPGHRRESPGQAPGVLEPGDVRRHHQIGRPQADQFPEPGLRRPHRGQRDPAQVVEERVARLPEQRVGEEVGRHQLLQRGASEPANLGAERREERVLERVEVHHVVGPPADEVRPVCGRMPAQDDQRHAGSHRPEFARPALTPALAVREHQDHGGHRFLGHRPEDLVIVPRRRHPWSVAALPQCLPGRLLRLVHQPGDSTGHRLVGIDDHDDGAAGRPDGVADIGREGS